MLRRLSQDLQNKSYAQEAAGLARPDKKLHTQIQNVLIEINNREANSIRSVIRTKNTVLIRAASRAASSELLTAQMAILKVVRANGATDVRFTV